MTILRDGATLERLFDGCFWAEGPAIGPDGCVYFCDITMTFRTDGQAGNIWKHDPRTGATTVFRSPSGMAAGIKFDSQGRMVCATGADFGNRCIVRTDMRTGRSMLLASLYNGHPFNAPNDLDIDDQDRIYFTDPRYFGHEPVRQPVFGVYRIDEHGKTALLLADVARPNGIALTLNQKGLYVVEHDTMMNDRRIADVPTRNGPMRILRYKLLEDGRASERKIFVDYGDESGADGIALDAEGRVYAGVMSATRPSVRVYDWEGTEICAIPTPERPTNIVIVTLDDGPWLYITATTSLYRIAVTTPGRRYAWMSYGE